MIELVASVFGGKLYSAKRINSPEARSILALVTVILFSTWGYGLMGGAAAAGGGVGYNSHLQDVNGKMAEVEEGWFEEMQNAPAIKKFAYGIVTPVLLISLEAAVAGAQIGYLYPNLSASFVPMIEPIVFSIVFLTIVDLLNAARRGYRK